MRRRSIAFGIATLSAALAATIGPQTPEASVRGGATTEAAKCSTGNHVAQAVSVAPEVTVAGKPHWKFLKPGDWLRTDEHGIVKLCLQQHRTSCQIGPNSSLRILPPGEASLVRFKFADISCAQHNTVVDAKRDHHGFYLPLKATEPTALRTTTFTGAAAPAVSGDPVFSIRIRKGQGIVKVVRGSAVIDTAGDATRAVVMGRNQQVVLTAAAEPGLPTKIKRLSKTERAVFAQLQKSLPKDSDRTPPAVEISGPHETSVKSGTFVIESPKEPAVFSCAFDESKDFRLCSSPFHVDRLPTGAHVLHVRATDAAGNTSDTPYPVNYDGSRIAFESFRHGNPEIYTVDPDGENVRRLTTNLISDEHPDWAPDRSRIAFDRLVGKNLDIWTIKADGTGDQRVTTDLAPDRNPTWSPDGTMIAFERGSFGSREIFVIKPDGTGERQLTRDNTDDLDPAWSPDSKRIVFASAREGGLDIYVMNADGTGVTRLTSDPTAEFGPSWSRLGKIAFHGARDGTPYKNIYVMDPDGKNVTRATRTEANDTNPSWAPDGLHIVFHSDRDKSREEQLYVLDVVTGLQTQITPGTADPTTADLNRVSFAPDW
jgi:Tol biopolymer transport system component